MDKIGLLFPGQGAQYPGMGKNLYETLEEAKHVVDMADQILGYPFSNIMVDSSEYQLRDTRVAQPAIFIASMMYFEKWKLGSNEFEMVAGHSLGEYTALCVSGVISFEDALRLVEKRAQYMAECCDDNQGMMAVLGLTLDEIEMFIYQMRVEVQIANVNSKTQIVVAGVINELRRLEVAINANGFIKTRWLNVSGAFHTDLMKKANEKLAIEIQRIRFYNTKCKFFSNSTGLETTDAETIKLNLLKQMVSTVKWMDIILGMKRLGAEKLFEIGPGNILGKLAPTIAFKPKCISMDKENY